VAREGSPAPGTSTGVNFGSFGNVVTNASGQVAFSAILQTIGGGVTPSNDRGLWAQDPSGQLTLVVREGDSFTVSPGVVRTINSIAFTADLSPSGGEDGRDLSFNDDFTLVFVLGFTNGTSGVFTATVPEPRMLGILLPAAAVIRRRRAHYREAQRGRV
jgi:hypothetical protein